MIRAAHGFPWREHRTLAEVTETGELLRRSFGSPMSDRNNRRLGELLKKQIAANPCREGKSVAWKE
jgi:hypothetical protein